MHHSFNLLVTVELVTSGQSIPAVERLVSLTAALLHRRMTKEEILTQVGGYTGDRSYATASRMFERDKALLRETGVPLVSRADAADGQTIRYWVDETQWSTSTIRPTPIQIALLSLALEALAPKGRHLPGRALTKLRALSPMSIVEADVALTTSLDLTDPEDAFDTLADAIAAKQEVSFDYLSARGEIHTRNVQPWRLVRDAGSWYLVGHDTDRGERRAFKLARLQTEPVTTTAPEAYEIPAQVDTRISIGHRETITARLRVAPGAAMLLRRHGTLVGHEGDDDVIEVTSDHLLQLAQDVASYGGDVLPVSPPELVSGVRELWETAARYAS